MTAIQTINFFFVLVNVLTGILDRIYGNVARIEETIKFVAVVVALSAAIVAAVVVTVMFAHVAAAVLVVAIAGYVVFSK